MANTIHTNTLRCPQCKSLNCECESTKQAHTHRCLDCGHETVAAPTRKTFAGR